MTLTFYDPEQTKREKGLARERDLAAETEAERDALQERNSLVRVHRPPVEVQDHFAPPLC